MSTILNALKKLEQELERSDDRVVNTRRSFQRSVRFSWIRQVGLRVIAICLVLVNVGVGLIIYFQQTRPSKTAASLTTPSPPAHSQKAAVSRHTAASRSDPVAQNSSTQNKSTASAIHVSQDSERSPHDSASLNHEQLPAFQNRSSRSANDATGSAPIKIASNTPVDPIAKTTTVSTTVPIKGKQDDIAATVAEDEPNASIAVNPVRYPDALRLTDGRLKVQAIAWAPDAEDRMAVVNTHIVREGNNVEEFTIVAIEEDDVVVREDGQLYRVPFGRP